MSNLEIDESDPFWGITKKSHFFLDSKSDPFLEPQKNTFFWILNQIRFWNHNKNHIFSEIKIFLDSLRYGWVAFTNIYTSAIIGVGSCLFCQNTLYGAFTGYQIRMNTHRETPFMNLSKQPRHAFVNLHFFQAHAKGAV